jgi:hypothetical protein
MSEHAWVQEQIAVYLTGGLDAREREKLESHAAECARCAKALDESRTVDRTMNALFADVRPEPGLEDRIIQALRAAPEPARPMLSRVRAGSTWFKLAIAVAAAVLMGILGTVVTPLLNEESAPRTAATQDGWRDKNIYGTLKYHNSWTSAPPSPPPEEMAGRLREQARLRLAGKSVEGEKQGRFEESLADHSESADDEFQKSKGESKDFAGGEQERGRWSRPGPGAPEPKSEPAREPAQDPAKSSEGYYSYRNDAPAPQPPSADYFKPSDATVLALKEEKSKEDALARLDETKKKLEEYKKSNDPKGKLQDPPQPQRKIIRTGEMEFEIDSFDSAVTTITKIVNEAGGYVGTVDSDKLPNGKVRGTIIVRVPPENLDKLVLQLRGLGELKSQRLASQDVTKQYTDLESKLRAKRTMETRFLDIIKTGKGEIKDLIEAEKQLGVIRTEIEQIEGEIRYYNNQTSLSTLTLTLTEKDIKTAATATVRERVTMGVEADNVEKAYADALAAIAEKKGRVTKSELKKLAADQFHALIQCEVSPEESGTLRDRITMLGRVARLDVSTQQSTDGTGLPAEIKVKKLESVFDLSFYNLANVQPRETVQITLACADAEGAYKAILARVAKAEGRVITSNFNRAKNDQSSGLVNFHVGIAAADAVLDDVKKEGEIIRMQVIENPDAANVTRSKKGAHVTIIALGAVQPRETATLQIVARDVAAAYGALRAAVEKSKGRMLNAHLDERDRQNISAFADFEARRDEDAAIEKALADLGDLYSRNVQRAPDSDNVVDSKVRRQVTIIPASRVVPRETMTFGVETSDVDRAVERLVALAAELKGRTVDQNVSREPNGRVTARVVIDVPLSSSIAAQSRTRELGIVRAQQSARNPQVPEGALAVARIDVTLANAELIVPSNEGIGAQLRSGLSASFKAISISLVMITVGLCVILPWALVVFAVWKIVKKMRAKQAVVATPPAPPAAA